MNLSRRLRQIQRAITVEYAKTCRMSLSIEQVSILTALIEKGPQLQADLCRACIIDRSTMSSMLRVMRRCGLVAKVEHEDYARRMAISITQRGVTMLDRSRKALERAEESVFERLPARKRVVAEKVLAQMAEAQ